jgi:SPP1 family predicted phage head-tail adaptor
MGRPIHTNRGAAEMTEFAGTLSERIVIERPLEVRDAMGRQGSGWEEVSRCFAAVALEGAGLESEAQALSAMARYRVTIRRRDGIAVGQRVGWSGRTMLVRQVLDDPRAKDRITLRCEEIRG